MKNRLLALFLAAALVFGATAAISPSALSEAQQKYSGTFFGTFDTVVTLIGFTTSQEAFDEQLSAVQALFTHYHQLFDNYNAYEGVNNLYTLNRSAAQAPVKVDQDLFDLLVWCKKQQEIYGSDINK